MPAGINHTLTYSFVEEWFISFHRVLAPFACYLCGLLLTELHRRHDVVRAAKRSDLDPRVRDRVQPVFDHDAATHPVVLVGRTEIVVTDVSEVERRQQTEIRTTIHYYQQFGRREH